MWLITMVTHLDVVLEVVNEEAHVCSQLPDLTQLFQPSPMLHQQSPALLESNLSPPDGEEHLKQSVVPTHKHIVK